MPTVQPFSATAPLKALAGTAAEPSITFTGNTGSGLYSPGANQVAIATGGVQRLLIGADGSITPASPLRFPLGTASSPSISFTGDTNTGIYSPGADQVAVATNGTGRLFVDSSGRVGVGLQSPTAPLTVGSAIQNTTQAEFIGLNPSRGLKISTGLNTLSDALVILDAQAPTGAFAFQTVSTERLRITSTGALNFVGAGTAGSTQAVSFNGSAPVNSLVIDSSGRVGVGTSSPDGLLTVRPASGNAQVFIRTNDTTSKSQLIFGDSADANTGGIQYNHTTDNLEFHVGNLGEKMTLDATGRLGIGASDPQRPLDVVSNASAETVTFRGASSNNISTLRFNSNNASTNYASIQSRPAYFEVATAASVPLLLMPGAGTGVGIGNTSPGYALDIVNSSTYQLRLASSTSNYASGGLYLGAAGTGDPYYYGYVQWNQASTTLDIAAQDGTGAGGLRFLTNGGATSPTERARIDVSGRLLVGTSTALTGATAQYSKNVNIGNSANSAGNAVVAIGRGTAAASLASGNQVGSIYFTDNGAGEFASIDCFVDGTPGANDYPGRLTFSVTSDGSASPTEALRITNDRYVRLASGTGGIQFNGDTAAANALDDYEEGTWTPTIVGSTTAGTGTYIFQNGRYTKIGRLVQVVFNVSISAHTGTGNIQVGGIPFSAESGIGGYFNVRAESLTFTGSQILCSLNVSTLELLQFSSASGATAIPLDTAFTLRVTGTYNV